MLTGRQLVARLSSRLEELSMRFSLASFLLRFVWLTLFFVACSEPTAPLSEGPADGSAAFDGAYEPGGTSFLLQRIDDPIPGHQPIRIELIGNNIELDGTQETVSVDVAIRNAGSESLFAPATIWLNRFIPSDVRPLNADFARDNAKQLESDDPLGTSGFDYSDLLGEDGVLGPDESSQAKTWIFHDPGLGSFSFSAEAEFGMEANRPVISGMLFGDENRNGIRDAGEGPFFAGGVTVQRPDGTLVHAGPDESGFYRIRVTEPGLHRVTFVSALACPACICETTPNPLEVFLTPGPDGEPRSFEDADFGIYPGPCVDPPPPGPAPLVVLTDLSPEEIDQSPYQLIWAELEGELLSIRVGYSGCTRDHPFTLHAARGFMESLPVQTWMLLAHDDRGEACRAYFERTLFFDLSPIQQAHIEDYGVPGIVRIHFRDFRGNETEFRLGVDLVTLIGAVIGIDDDVPVDGGVVVELQLDSGETIKLFFGSLFTSPPPPQWRFELYAVIAGLELGDRVRATGTSAPGGITLRGLTILER
jgi:hypothetical protein